MQKWKQILQQCGIQVPLDKVEFNVRCPLHDDRNPSLSLNILKGVWYCHSGCGSGRLTDFVRKYYDTPLMQLSGQTDNFDALLLDTVLAEPLSYEELLPIVQMPFKIGEYPSWIFERDFTVESLQKWECGISAERSLVIPIKDIDKRLVGWVCRRIDGRSPKYVYSAGLETSKIVFGLYNIKRDPPFLCVTEGPLDTIWLDQCGFSSVALLGCNLSVVQQALIDRCMTGEVVLCLDSDIAGQAATEKLFSRLKKHHVVTCIALPKGVKDVQEVRNLDYLTEIIKNRSVY